MALSELLFRSLRAATALFSLRKTSKAKFISALRLFQPAAFGLSLNPILMRASTFALIRSVGLVLRVSCELLVSKPMNKLFQLFQKNTKAIFEVVLFVMLIRQLKKLILKFISGFVMAKLHLLNMPENF